jgi:hypothetical protein
MIILVDDMIQDNSNFVTKQFLYDKRDILRSERLTLLMHLVSVESQEGGLLS